MQDEWGSETDSSSTDSHDDLARLHDKPPMDVQLRLAYGAIFLGKSRLPNVTCTPADVFREMAQAGVNYAHVMKNAQVSLSYCRNIYVRGCLQCDADALSQHLGSRSQPPLDLPFSFQLLRLCSLCKTTFHGQVDACMLRWLSCLIHEDLYTDSFMTKASIRGICPLRAVNRVDVQQRLSTDISWQRSLQDS